MLQYHVIYYLKWNNVTIPYIYSNLGKPFYLYSPKIKTVSSYLDSKAKLTLTLSRLVILRVCLSFSNHYQKYLDIPP